MSESEVPLIEVAASSYDTVYTRVSDELVHMRHSFHKPAPSVEQDVFARFWNVNFCVFPPGKVLARHGERRIDLAGPALLVIPPFSVLEWHLEPFDLRF